MIQIKKYKKLLFIFTLNICLFSCKTKEADIEYFNNTAIFVYEKDSILVYYEIPNSYKKMDYCVSWDTNYAACYSNDIDTIQINIYTERPVNIKSENLCKWDKKFMLEDMNRVRGCIKSDTNHEELPFNGVLLKCENTNSTYLEFSGCQQNTLADLVIYLEVTSLSSQYFNKLKGNDIFRHLIKSIKVQSVTKTQ